MKWLDKLLKKDNKKKYKVCKIWRELDTEEGDLFEYCSKAHQRCNCAGVDYQCNYPQYFKEMK